MANEHSYIRAVNRYLRQDPKIGVWKIRADAVNGIPDCFYDGPIGNIWVEFKYLKEVPKRDSTLIDLKNTSKFLSKLQQNWLEKKHSNNISTAVILGSPLGGVFFYGLEWEEAISTERFKASALPTKKIAALIQHFCTTAGTNGKQNYHEKRYQAIKEALSTLSK